MKILTIAADGNTLIYEREQLTGGIVRQKGATSVYILENDDTAIVTFGTKNSSGTFVAFPDGAVTEGSKINHGARIPVWVNVAGITANSVELGISE